MITSEENKEIIMHSGASSSENLPRKRKKTFVLFDFSPNVPVQNQYDLLRNNTSDEITEKENGVEPMNTTPHTPTINVVPTNTHIQNNTNKAHVPPITVTGMTSKQLIDTCNSINLKNFRLKLTSKGINVICNNVADFKVAKAYFAEQKTQFFTHDLKEEKEFRVIIKGLLKTDIEELRAALKDKGIEPNTIRELTPKKLKFNDQTHYVLSFPLGATKINVLKQCKYLCSLVIEWDLYIPRKYGPTRCHNCQIFGHGSRQCSMQTKCPACAGPHKIEDCTAVDENGCILEGKKLKCANCGGEHPATYENCPKLIEYLQIQERIAAKNTAKFSHTKANAPPFNTREFPQLPQRTRAFRPAPPPTYNAWSHANTNTPKRNGSSDLFSTQELLQLTQELVVSLRNCKTRFDQLNVITELAFRFVGQDGSP